VKLILPWIVLALATPSIAEGAWYAERLSSGDSPVRVEHLWSKSGRLRSETVFLGHPIVTIVKGDQYVIYDRLAGTGVSIQRSPVAIQQAAGRDRLFGNELDVLVEAGGEKVRVEELSGRACDLYRLTNQEGRREVCVTQDESQLPVFRRVWMRASGKTAEARYLEWSSELEVDDGFFVPDPRVHLEFVTYDDYLKRASKERIGPIPPLHRELLHGR